MYICIYIYIYISLPHWIRYYYKLISYDYEHHLKQTSGSELLFFSLTARVVS